MRKNTERIAGWVFDLEGRLRLATRTADNGDTEILRVDPSGFTKVYSCSVFETCGTDRFHKDGQRVYLQTNKGDADLMRLVLFDPETGKEELVESDPAEARGLRRRGLLRGDRRADRPPTYEDERVAHLLPRQGAARPTTSCCSGSSRARTSRWAPSTADDQLCS